MGDTECGFEREICSEGGRVTRDDRYGSPEGVVGLGVLTRIKGQTFNLSDLDV